MKPFIRTMIVTFLMLVAASSVQAGVKQCVSTDKDHTLKVTLDQDANTVTVNGDKRSVHVPASGGREGVFLVSDAYDTDEYGIVYISVAKDKDENIVISQVGAKDNKVRVSFTLDCK
jgi:hypothetical protein